MAAQLARAYGAWKVAAQLARAYGAWKGKSPAGESTYLLVDLNADHLNEMQPRGELLQMPLAREGRVQGGAVRSGAVTAAAAAAVGVVRHADGA